MSRCSRVLRAIGVVFILGLGELNFVAASPDFNYNWGRPALLWADNATHVYSGIAKLEGLGMDCTAWLADVGGSPDDFATMLTAGHCTGNLDSTTVIQNANPSNEKTTASFFPYVDTPGLYSVLVTKIQWASMRVYDVAVLSLNVTNRELAAKGIPFYTLSGNLTAGERVINVGVPIFNGTRYLRQTNCTSGNVTRVNERLWIWEKARRLFGPECGGILPGSSGSPLFDPQGRAVGIVSTSTIGAEPNSDCYMGAPCEIHSDGMVYLHNTSYSMELEPLLPCFQRGKLLVGSESCPLEAASTAVQVPGSSFQKTNGTWTVDAKSNNADIKTVRWKYGMLTETDCRNASGYTSTAVPIADSFNASITSDMETRYVACAAPVVGSNGTLVKNAGFKILKVDRTPPTLDPYLFTNVAVDVVIIYPLYILPELSVYQWKWGAKDKIDCKNESDLRPYRNDFQRLDNTELPGKVCVKAADEAGNWGPVKEFVVTLNGTTSPTTTTSVVMPTTTSKPAGAAAIGQRIRVSIGIVFLLSSFLML